LTPAVDSSTDRPRTPLLEARAITKIFPGTVALDGVGLAVHAGDVVAVVGANGSGKTTLLSVLCGLHQATAGEVAVDGHTVSFASPSDALSKGIVYIPQEPQLAPTMSAWENVLLAEYGRLARRRPNGPERAEARVIAHAALDGHGPDTSVAKLRKAERATLALAAGLRHHPRVLALDEPTAVLGDRGVAIVERAAHEVLDAGGAVLLVSHRLRDIVRLATRVVVLVDGKLVHEGPIDTSTVGTLIDTLSSGRDTPRRSEPSPPHSPSRGIARGDTVISLADVHSVGGLSVDELVVRSGEIVGVAGVAGSGRSRLCRLVAGGSKYTGSIDYSGGHHCPNPSAMRRHGIGYLPEDRQREGVFPSLSVERNLEVADLVSSRSLARPWRWHPDRNRWAALADRFGVKRSAETASISSLSGGNQQRVVLARTLARHPTLLVADEPTQGVDRSGRFAIHSMIQQFVDDGGAALVVSSELDELLELCDRIVVMVDSSMVATVSPEISYRDLMSYATTGEVHGAVEPTTEAPAGSTPRASPSTTARLGRE
jgi:ABC-type sugar transport system ATPase subunit